jgi:hypothetical protein
MPPRGWRPGPSFFAVRLQLHSTPRGLLVACLRRTRRKIYAITPLSVARYRERHTVTRAKSDRVAAELLARVHVEHILTKLDFRSRTQPAGLGFLDRG